MQLLADLEDRQQLVVRHAQLQQLRLLVVGVELAEVGREARVVEEAAGQRHRLQLFGAAFGPARRYSANTSPTAVSLRRPMKTL